ncbi:MAG: hypothetical protein KGJ13_10590 [Patescibacteria group bacterium]|nr:hypothetical protein [Patescibacteria group bacterium]
MEIVKILEALSEQLKSRADYLARLSGRSDVRAPDSLIERASVLYELKNLAAAMARDLKNEPATSRKQTSAQPTVDDLLKALGRLGCRISSDVAPVLKFFPNGTGIVEFPPYRKFFSDPLDALKAIENLSPGNK